LKGSVLKSIGIRQVMSRAGQEARRRLGWMALDLPVFFNKYAMAKQAARQSGEYPPVRLMADLFLQGVLRMRQTGMDMPAIRHGAPASYPHFRAQASFFIRIKP